MKIYNTLTKIVDEIKPINDNNINIFVCGPTVYDFSHLGHAKTYIQMDVLVRTLRKFGYKVTYLQNITDIDDKIINRANENNVSWRDLSKDFENAYKEDMQKLNNVSVDIYARATDHIDDILVQVEKLLESGHAYVIEGDGIYFEISTFPEYGKLSGRQEIKKNDAESRIDQSDSKRGWNDFCLWKFSKDGEPTWESKFGDGRPGWHIEDTAISEHFFGQQYDMHGGAIDLIFPHHEAEITQMEAISVKKPFVKYWVHSGFLNINSEKMSKSLGNFYTIRDVVKKGVDPMTLRLFVLQSHYRSGVDFTFDSLEVAKKRLASLQAIADLRFQSSNESTYSGPNIKEVEQNFLEALFSDLNTPKALAYLSEVESISEYIPKSEDFMTKFTSLFNTIDETLGLNLMVSKDITDEQKELIKQRQISREQKDWTKSDKIRNELENQGIGLNDKESYSVWYRI